MAVCINCPFNRFKYVSAHRYRIGIALNAVYFHNVIYTRMSLCQ